MAQATRLDQATFGDYVQRVVREGAMWALMCMALYLVISLASYTPQDPGWSHVGHGDEVFNAGGRAGAWFSDVALYLFGLFSYLIPVMVGWSAYLVFKRHEPEPETRLQKLALRWLGFFITLAAGCALASIHLPQFSGHLPNGIGGGLGQLIGGQMTGAFSATGASLFLFGLFLAGFTLFSGLSWLAIIDLLGAGALTLLRWTGAGMAALLGALAPRSRSSSGHG